MCFLCGGVAVIVSWAIAALSLSIYLCSSLKISIRFSGCVYVITRARSSAQFLWYALLNKEFIVSTRHALHLIYEKSKSPFLERDT